MAPPPGARVRGHHVAAAAPPAPVLAPVAAVVKQGSADELAVGASAHSALANTAAKAPQFLVFTVRNVEIATISLLHASEPQGQDLVDYVNSQTQKATSAAQGSLQSAKKTTDTNATTAAGATKVAAASTPDPATQSQVQESNTATQANLANTSQQLSIVSKILSDAGDCKQLGGSSFVTVPTTSTSTSPAPAGS